MVCCLTDRCCGIGCGCDLPDGVWEVTDSCRKFFSKPAGYKPPSEPKNDEKDDTEMRTYRSSNRCLIVADVNNDSNGEADVTETKRKEDVEGILFVQPGEINFRNERRTSKEEKKNQGRF